jgi:hypothetical protein
MKKLILLTTLLALAACSPKEIVPDAPDYDKDSSWYVVDRGSDIDLFYICSTSTFDYEKDGAVVHWSWAADSAACHSMREEMEGVDRILSGGLNFYSPYYRQITMETYLDTALISSRFQLTMEDVNAAFNYYIDNFNEGRPFVLAGFSQGGQALVELLKGLPEELHERMVAAYVLGWKITEDEVEEYGSIIPATGAYDTGVTICYNSVEDPEDATPLISEGNAVAINPVNWVTDSTPAVLFDTLTVTLDQESKLLLVDGFEGTGYAWKPYFKDGCYHTFEIRWYGASLRKNIADRCSNYLSKE